MKKILKVLAMACVLLVMVACAEGNNSNHKNNNHENNTNNNSETNEANADRGSDHETIARDELADVFLNGEFDRVYAQMGTDFKAEVTADQLENIGEGFNEGVEAYVLQSDMALDDALTQLTWVDEAEEKGVVAVFSEDDRIEGFQVLQLDSYPETDDVFTETEFELPFEGEWFVVWGGTNELVNYHYAVEAQRYAFDILRREGNSSYDGDPEENESYYAFGEEMLAPADGVVVEVENGIADNEPVGEMNADEPLGNHVIIDHGNDEYSFLAHFKEGSIEVAAGDEVKTGDLLGLVGNSGNSSEPHIHFHVADGPDSDESTSIRVNFGDLELIQGDVVEP